MGYFNGPVSVFAQQLRELFKDNPVGLEQLIRLLDENPTPRQSGMEAKHEAWVLSTLNFLAAMNIPVWNYDARGNRIKPDKEIPERLDLVLKEFRKLMSDCGRLTELLRSEREKIERLQKQVDACVKLLDEIAHTMAPSLPQELKDKLLETFPEFLAYFVKPPESATTPEDRPPDPPGS